MKIEVHVLLCCALLSVAACGNTGSSDADAIIATDVGSRDAEVLDFGTLDGADLDVGSADMAAADAGDLDMDLLDAGSESPCVQFEEGRTVGTRICEVGAAPGYTLFSPIGATETYLVDLDGRLVHQWSHTLPPGQSVTLLEDGRLLRPTNPGDGTLGGGGQGGGLELIAWDGTVEWSFDLNNDTARAHHDVTFLPNGNIVLIAWEQVKEENVIAAGRRAAVTGGELWPDFLVEVRPEPDGGATVVWEWHAWDHLVQSNDNTLPTYGLPKDHPGRMDIDFGGARGPDWLHINAVAYDAQHDQLILSVHHTSEVWIIDHGTTTAEAAGPAGDILYRWGNPIMWGAGTAADQKLYLQHDTHLIPEGLPGAGNMLVFNNGNMTDRTYSSVDELVLPRLADGGFALKDGSFGPDAALWSYSDPATFDSNNISGAQRLPGGTTLICEGATGRFFEVTPTGEVVWEYQVPVGRMGILPQGSTTASRAVFRANRYAPDFAGFAGRDLTPGDVIEN